MELTCCKGVQETLTHKSIPATKETDISKVIHLTDSINDRDNSDHTPINEEEKNDADQISINEITDLNPDMENDLNLQVSNNVGSSDVFPSLVQEMPATERGFEGIVAHESEPELVVNNVTTEDKSCSKVANKGKQICEDNQCLQELRKSCKSALKITEKDIVPEHNAEQFPPVTGDDVQAGDSEMNRENENEIQDLHQKKSSKKFKRVRLLREILREDEEPVVEHIRRGRPALQNPSNKSADSQRQKTVMEKVVGEGDTKKLEKKGQPGRKRKLVVDEDEEDAPLTDLIQRAGNEVSNEEGLEERLHLSSNSSPQTLLRPVQEGPGGETDSTGEGIFPLTTAFSTEGKGVPTEEIDETTREQNELEALVALLQISQINMVNEEPESQIKQLKEISMDLNVGTGGSDPILRKLNPGESSKTKMDTIGSSQTYGSLKDNLSGKSHAAAISEMLCGTNRNPAEFTPIEAENPYLREEKDEVRKRVSGGKSCGSSSKQNKKPKKP
ncbi:uncharacterized protein LOC108337822 [Vigna angularis]|uniref:uncharacterized protein LOC108337822 n=1 Tax=Phaseolus angularis TaxID=3914 RepID=UPI0022B53E3A|nr:uncharacterized protein LOC108337822 [Vigna angularis]